MVIHLQPITMEVSRDKISTWDMFSLDHNFVFDIIGMTCMVHCPVIFQAMMGLATGMITRDM